MTDRENKKNSNDPSSQGWKTRPVIMVVDDDEALQIYIKKVLEDFYEVIQATTVGQALSHLNKRPVDLLLLDLMLPSISGINLCRKIKNRWQEKSVPIIVLTAKTDLESKVEALEAGADDYITKPFHHQELLTRIKVQLRIKHLQRELIKTERLKAIIETAISANHEINNPLCVIMNHAELLLNAAVLEKNTEMRQSLENILDNAQRIEKTIKKMANIIQPVITDYLPGVPMLDIESSKTKEKH